MNADLRQVCELEAVTWRSAENPVREPSQRTHRDPVSLRLTSGFKDEHIYPPGLHFSDLKIDIAVKKNLFRRQKRFYLVLINSIGRLFLYLPSSLLDGFQLHTATYWTGEETETCLSIWLMVGQIYNVKEAPFNCS